MHEITQCVIKRGKEKQYMSVSFALRANLCWKPTSSCYFMDSSHWEWFWWPMRLMEKETLAKNAWSQAWDWHYFHSFSVWFCPFLDQRLAVILTVSYWNKLLCDLVIVVLYLTQLIPLSLTKIINLLNECSLPISGPIRPRDLSRYVSLRSHHFGHGHDDRCSRRQRRHWQKANDCRRWSWTICIIFQSDFVYF